MLDFFKNRNGYEDYTKSRMLGYNLKVLREYNDETFLQICCQGPSEGRIPFISVNSSQFARVFRFEYRGEIFYYKIFLSRNWLEPFKKAFIGSRAERALKGHLLLQKNGFCAPCIAVIGTKGSNNFMVSRAVNGLSVNQLLKQLSTSAQSKEKKDTQHALIEQFAHIIGRLHKLGISHGDLHLENVIAEVSDLSRIRYVFLDNEQTVHYRKLPNRKRLNNIARIDMYLEPIATRTDRLHYFRAYCEENPELIAQEKKLLAQINRKKEKRIARKLRHRPANSKKLTLTSEGGNYA